MAHSATLSVPHVSLPGGLSLSWLRARQSPAAQPHRRAAAPRDPAGATRDLDELLLASATGDRKAFERLYRLSSTTLYALVRRKVWARSEAEEVLQEVYVKVWRCAASFDPRQAAAGTWMARIARNHAIDHLRRCTGRVAHECPLDTGPGDGDETEQFADPGLSPQDTLIQRQASRQMDALLACLSAAQRQVLVLAFREGLTQEEIASRLDAPLGTVKSWMRRGLQSLKESKACSALGM